MNCIVLFRETIRDIPRHSTALCSIVHTHSRIQWSLALLSPSNSAFPFDFIPLPQSDFNSRIAPMEIRFSFQVMNAIKSNETLCVIRMKGKSQTKCIKYKKWIRFRLQQQQQVCLMGSECIKPGDTKMQPRFLFPISNKVATVYCSNKIISSHSIRCVTEGI